jgi:hypothetical protein
LISFANYLRARGLDDEAPPEYEGDRAYPDRELVGYVERVAARTDVTVDETLHDFGRFLGAVRLEQPQCMLRGEPVCSLVVELV